VPYRCRLTEIDLWYAVNSTNITYALLLWKQQKIVDSNAENNTLLYQGPDTSETSTRPKRLILTPADFGDVIIEDDEIWAISIATVVADASVRYFYIRGGRALFDRA